MNDGIGDGLLSEPAGVDVDGRGNIVLADSRNCRVQGIGDGLLSEPARVDVDGRGNIVLADSRNCRVQVFKPSGEFYCHVDLENVFRPSDIALTNDGYLIVVNYTQHHVKKYKLGK
ncbi:uncharacterized protein LOC144906125 [Branchiostoma floridae x Branchiostoma belcheri]